MPQRMSLSRAARLVGVKRGTLQKQIADGLLESFDGEIDISGLLKLYPEAQLEDSTMLERVERIMEDAVCKKTSDDRRRSIISALAARVSYMGRDLADARKKLSDYRNLVKQLQQRLDTLESEAPGTALSATRQWLDTACATLAEQADTLIEDEFLVKDSMLKFMTSHVRVLPSGHDFFVEGSETLLEAGLRSGLNMSYGCSSGTCGKCKARVISGEVSKIRPHDYLLSEPEKFQRYVLTCCNTAITDVVLDAEEVEEAGAIPQQELTTRIKSIAYPHDHIMVVRAKMPRTERLRFMGGQSIRLSIGGVQSAPLAIASCPCDETYIEFHIHETRQAALWSAFSQHKPSDRLTVNGPLGDFVLDKDSPHSAAFIAFGSGFAAIKSLIEHAMALDTAESLTLLWFSTESEGGFYMNNRCRSWNDALDNFAYHCVESTTDDYPNLAGELQQLLQSREDFQDLDYYLSGPEEVIQRARTVLLNAGVATTQQRLNVA